MDTFAQFHADLQRLILLNLSFNEQKEICSKFIGKVPTACQPNDEVMIMRLDKDYNIQKPFTLRQYYDLIDRVSKSDLEFYYRQKMYKEYIKMQGWNKKMFQNLIDDEVFLKNYINETDKYGNSLFLDLFSIMEPTEDSTKDVFIKLIQHGADVNLPNIDGYTPLISAVDSGNKNFIQLLLDNGADIKYIYPYGRNRITALILSILVGEFEIAKILIKNKADVNYQDSEGMTALMYLAKSYNKDKKKEMIQVLLDAGADPTIVNNKGRTYQDILDKWERNHKVED